MQTKTTNKAFTLIELIVVMAIIAILVLLATPSFLNYTKDAKVTAMKQDTKVLADAAEIYHAENNEWPVSQAITEHNIGGVDELYTLDKLKLRDSIKNIKEDYDDYGLVISGKNEGQIFHINGQENKDGEIIYSHDGTKAIDMSEEEASKYYSFKKLSDGGYEINGFSEDIKKHTQNKKTPSKLILPTTIDGHNVVRIGRNSFSRYRDENDIEPIKEVTLPERLTEIGYAAFRENQLESISIPETVDVIKGSSFRSNKIKSLTMPDKLSEIGQEAFNSNELPDNLATFYARKDNGKTDKTTVVSYGGKRKDKVVVPEGVTNIARWAYAFNDINSIILPGSLIDIGMSAFGHNNLKSVNMPESLEVIDNHAFQHNNLVKIQLNNNLRVIENNAFTDNKLSEVNIPYTVKELGNNILRNNGPNRNSNSVIEPGRWLLNGKDWEKY